ncbi:hypothetical protein [Salininema proteolyticum]|uniref:Integral membrane protein n=1 Tax=Salininema proteolyticum TaxID=1607685 RepID=A0ABV8TSI2_9ACTN
MKVPNQVKLSVALWCAAIAAGFMETFLTIGGMAVWDGVTPELWLDFGFRVVVYTMAGVFVHQFYRGQAWARPGLTALMTVFGVSSIVLPYLFTVGTGMAVNASFDQSDPLAPLFLADRVFYVLCALGATGLMYLPRTDRFLRSAPSRFQSAGR